MSHKGQSQLPVWVAYANALAVPIIAIVDAWIAARQMFIADEKLRYDEFYRQYDKRFAIYEATRKFFARAFEDIDLSEDEVRVYGFCTLDARFLFDDHMANFLREVHRPVATWQEANWMASHASSTDKKSEYEKIRRENLNWIIAQGDEQRGFATKFAPFLVQREGKRPWWLGIS